MCRGAAILDARRWLDLQRLHEHKHVEHGRHPTGRPRHGRQAGALVRREVALCANVCCRSLGAHSLSLHARYNRPVNKTATWYRDAGRSWAARLILLSGLLSRLLTLSSHALMAPEGWDTRCDGSCKSAAWSSAAAKLRCTRRGPLWLTRGFCSMSRMCVSYPCHATRDTHTDVPQPKQPALSHLLHTLQAEGKAIRLRRQRATWTGSHV